MLLDALPQEVHALCEAIRGLMIHPLWARHLGIRIPQEREEEMEIRTISAKLDRIIELDNHPLSVPRLSENRLLGNCRDFAVMLTSVLRHHGVPARARCGFVTYIVPNRHTPHWLCEYWKSNENRWVLVDSELGSTEQRILGVRFDVTDVPDTHFMTAGEAWLRCLAGESDPNLFGSRPFGDIEGLWIIRAYLVRDLACLNKLEPLPGDEWGLIAKKPDNVSKDDIDLLNQVAEITASIDHRLAEAKHIIEDDRLEVPGDLLT